jgi:pimeloyl-ACP methyl ester carboxylesterase
MSQSNRSGGLGALRGYAQLSGDAVVALSRRVEHMHANVLTQIHPALASPSGTTQGITGFVYRRIRDITQLSQRLTCTGLEALSSNEQTALSSHRAILNGLFGDHLAASGNPLALPMRLTSRSGDDVAETGWDLQQGRLLILLPGLCMLPGQWQNNPLAVQQQIERRCQRQLWQLEYNSGLAILENGRQFAQQLESLYERRPNAIKDLALVGFSMGGLVAQAGVWHAQNAGYQWPKALRHLAMLGSPQHGAELEQIGEWLSKTLQLSRFSLPFADIAAARSHGITDLRHGLSEPVHSPMSGVRYHALAATRSASNGQKKRLRGDGLVTVSSALASGRQTTHPVERHVIYSCHHLGLLNHPRTLIWLQRQLAT